MDAALTEGKPNVNRKIIYWCRCSWRGSTAAIRCAWKSFTASVARRAKYNKQQQWEKGEYKINCRNCTCSVSRMLFPSKSTVSLQSNATKRGECSRHLIRDVHNYLMFFSSLFILVITMDFHRKGPAWICTASNVFIFNDETLAPICRYHQCQFQLTWRSIDLSAARFDPSPRIPIWFSCVNLDLLRLLAFP